jgi:DNA-binding NarL/FixJ family response regulator
MRILLADDQPVVRSAIRLLLEQQPEANVVEESADTNELLDKVRNFFPDMLLLDWELPGLISDNIVAQIRNMDPGLVIIALSSRLQTRREALKAGTDDFVSKNDPPDHLLAAVKSSRTLIIRRSFGGYLHDNSK